MAQTRYNALLTRIKNRSNTRTEEMPSDINEIISDNAFYMSLLHPEGWSWMRKHVTLTGETESVTLDATFDSGDLPRTHGMWIVRCRVGASGDWKTLEYLDVGQIMERPQANRSAVTSLPERVYWTVVDDGTSRTLELYPISVDGVTTTLSYDIYYIRRVLDVGDYSGTEDTAFIWPERGYDAALAWLCMSDIAFDKNDMTREAAAWDRFTQLMRIILQGEGVPASRIKFPPRRVIQEIGFTS